MRKFAAAIKISLAASAAVSMPAWAQDTPSAPAAASTGAEAGSGADDIVVTARRRVERVQDIAATVDVLSGQDLRQSGVTTATQIEYAVPGLQFGNGGFDGALIGLRGVSSERGYTGDEAAVAVHVDGVFQPQSGQALARLFDVERVEVLKGPQGTLYGRNANAGVINIISTAPSDKLGGYVRASYGSFDTFRGEGAINLPLGQDQALRLSVAGARGKGYIKNILDDRTFGDNKFIAGRLRYRGTFGRATVDLSAQYLSDNSQNDGAVTPARRAADVLTTRATGFYDTIVNVPTGQHREDANLALQVDVDLGSVGLKSITGGTKFYNRFRTDASPADEPVPAGDGRGKQDGYSVSEELTLYARNPNRFDWRVGLYYTYADVNEKRYTNVFDSPDFNADFYDNFRFNQTGNAYAVYADGSYKLTDKLKLTLGGRYNIEDKTQRQAEIFGLFSPPIPDAPVFAPVPSATALDCSKAVPFDTCYSASSAHKTWRGVTARAGLDYAITKDNLLYASYGRGFRSGAIGGIVAVNAYIDRATGGTGIQPLTPLDPEKVDAFEIGSKNSFANGRVVANIAGFYTIYSDQLFIATDPKQPFKSFEGNLGRSIIKGFDASLSIEPVRDFKLSGNIEVLDAKIDRLTASNLVPNVSVGNRLPRAPQFSSAVAADWRLPVADGAFDLRAEFNYKGRHYLNLQNTLVQGPVGLVNLSARYDSHKDRGFYVFGDLRNLTGKHYLVAGGVASDARAGSIGFARPGEPFTFEVGGGIKF